MNGLKNLSLVTAAAFIAQLHSIKAEATTINRVNPGELSVTGLITFDGVAKSDAPGTNNDAIYESNGANFAERFVGQTLSVDRDFDILSGTPTGPLALQAGKPGQNLNIFANEETLNTNALTGLGSLGFPEPRAVGEGSLAILFNSDQSEFGFDLLGGDGGSATVSLFRRNGSLIENIVLDSLGQENRSYGFRHDGGLKDIAGFSIYNTDNAGIGFDNLRKDVSSVASAPTPGNDVAYITTEPAPIADGSPVATEPAPIADGSPVASEPTPVPFEFSPGLGILVLGVWGAIAQLKSCVQKRKTSGREFSNN